MQCIAYKKGYKYQLHADYTVAIPIQPGKPALSDYIILTIDGQLTIKKGYAWDGPSGPTIDTLNFMRGSLVHDALYQLMREKLLDREKYREEADKLLQAMCVEDGMTALRAWWVYNGVRFGGDGSTDPINDKKLIRAPKACQ